MIAAIIIGCVGFLIIVFSILFIKFKKIDLLQEYHRDKLKEEDKNIVNRINDSNSDFVWIGLGAPKQEPHPLVQSQGYETQSKEHLNH